MRWPSGRAGPSGEWDMLMVMSGWAPSSSALQDTVPYKSHVSGMLSLLYCNHNVVYCKSLIIRVTLFSPDHVP